MAAVIGTTHAVAQDSLGLIGHDRRGGIDLNANSPVVPRTVSGRVIDGVSGAPIARARVNLSSRAVMTDAQGRFSFPLFNEEQAVAFVMKPGYTASANPNEGMTALVVSRLDSNLELKLYPDALITGTVVSQEGVLLPRVQIRLSRANYEATGLSWNSIAATTTDSRGRYRFMQPAGKYRLHTEFTAKLQDSEDTLLPSTFPVDAASNTLGFFSLANGQQKQIDLTVSTSKTYPVFLQVEPATTQQSLQLNIKTATGDSFFVPAQLDKASFETRIDLPPGAYTLRGRSGDRGEQVEGTTTFSVTEKRPAKIMLRLSPIALLPLEVSLDAAGPASAGRGGQAGGPRQTQSQQEFSMPQLNLYLQNEENEGDNPKENIRPELRAGGYGFRVAPGRYRLRSYPGAPWFVESASYGAADLLRGDILVSQGSAGLPIRLVVGNAVGQVQGHVRNAGGEVAPEGLVWVYLMPQSPSLSGLREMGVSFQSGFNSSLPAGTYTAVAIKHRAQVDLQDAQARAHFFATGKTFNVSAGESVSLDLVISPAQEEVP